MELNEIFNIIYGGRMMTKEEKIRRFEEMNKEVVPGQIVCAGSSLMEMMQSQMKKA